MTGSRHSRLIRAATWLTGAALTLVCLTACQNDDRPPQPTPSPSATTTVAPSPSPSIAPPAAPIAAPTQKSAEAFVRYFWEVYNYSYSAQDIHTLQSISRPTCIFCQATLKAITDLTAKSQRIVGSDIRLELVAAPPTDPKVGLILSSIISEKPGKTLSSDGSTIDHTDGVRNMKSEIALDWTGKKWLVRDLANDETSGKPW